MLRQLGELFIDDMITANRFVPRVLPARSLGRLLNDRLPKLADLLGCPLSELRLDHDPALENRTQLKDREGGIIGYDPPANDPDHLRYRPHSPVYQDSHHIKTNVRGDHGQFPDNTLAKRERRRQKKLMEKAKAKSLHRKKKSKIASRKNPWPQGRKIRCSFQQR